MKNLWQESEAATFTDDLSVRVYSSRLLGGAPDLVLHGGGNTSVKSTVVDVFGDAVDVLYVKGSGWDLATIEAAGFSPCRLAHLLRLSRLPELSDIEMARELASNLLDASAPMPSVEAILHAILPAKFVDHTHADAIVTITNTPDGENRIREIFGESVVVVPYVMPGFKLARACAELYPKHAGAETVGMVLMNHGVFTFGETARESYDRMIDLVSRAESFLERGGALRVSFPDECASTPDLRAVARLRADISTTFGAPVVLMTHQDRQALGFAGHPELTELALQGPATPDHVIRTKRVPLIGRDVAGYAARYRRYFERHARRSADELTMLDPAPRVVLDPEIGMAFVGRRAKDAMVVGDIYRHTVDMILRATALDRWQALSAGDIFDVEYWELEQAKLRRVGAMPPLAGRIAMVTGAASGIGKACVDALLARGVAVVGLDINPDIESAYDRPDALGLHCDITDETQFSGALEKTILTFGGLDIVVLNAGIFPKSASIGELPDEMWRRVMRVNLDCNLSILRETHPYLSLAPDGGRIVVIGSKNAAAPGPGVAAYSASKAALVQLARVAALEWAADRIRVNVIHPNAVFDTGLWTREVLAARAAHYGLSIDAYKTNNLLSVEITSRDVAELAAEMCGSIFAKTTGAQIPIDGGSDRVI